jgi:NAD(P)H dehydrogenase (quinone)
MKLAVIYHSETGNTQKVAKVIASAAQEIASTETQVMSIDNIDESFIDESAAVIFGCPTYCGTFSWQIKKFFDTTNIKLNGKLGAVFVTENHLGGGADIAELSVAGCMLVRSMLVYSGGALEGNPLTHFGAVVQKSGDDLQLERAKVFGQRIAKKAHELFS